MNNQWKTFLESRSAQLDERDNVRFPDAPSVADCALTDLSPLGLIAITGPEAADFLQGQLTNDVRELSPSHTQLSAHCSPKGRMLSSFRVMRIDDGFYLQLPRTRVEATIQRLRMFLLRAKVAIEDAGDRLIAIGLSGDCALALLASRFEALPEQDNGMARSGNLALIRIPGPVPRFQVLGPVEAMESLWDELAAQATPVNADCWSLLDIRAGIPTVYPETSDAFVPQMANLQLIDGVSFTKGCYTGQEVVARMQYLGKLKRRMYLAEVSTDSAPKPGDELHSPSSSSEQASGRVVDARPSGNGRYALLAVVEIEAAENNEVRLGPDGPLLSFKEPPYGFSAGS
ncbi:MAG: folate-binding protein YgfZ [Pseudomonadota bacterium]|nr:folate-binding protein YgfZ [Pseudomonadota bacterium]